MNIDCICQADASTQFSQEWARRKVVLKHSIKSIKYQADAELNVLVYFHLETTGCN